LRFDDRLTTVIAQPAGDSGALTAAWMQIVDILAQDKGVLSAQDRQIALDRLSHWRDKVPSDRRVAAATMLAQKTLAPDIVSLFALDSTEVAAPILKTTHLQAAEWAKILPQLPATSRSVLDGRTDLPPETQALLNSFGQNTLALPSYADDQESTPAETVDLETPTTKEKSDISILVSRIEAFRQNKQKPTPQKSQQPEHITSFRFETNADGIIIWVKGAPMPALIGIDIATMADVGSHGVDGHAAGAFKRRTPYNKARLVVPGTGPASGPWLISGLPSFNEANGRFTGYRGVASRLERIDAPSIPVRSILGPGMPADSIRQLVHELRTPLNAIRGFSEMIAGQVLGPASSAYRARAEEIISDSKRLLGLFEDLDVAAKLDHGMTDGRGQTYCNPSDILKTLADEYRPMSDTRNVHVRFVAPQSIDSVHVDALTMERMVSRLLGTAIGLAKPGETIVAELKSEAECIAFHLTRPNCLKGMTGEAMVDPSSGPEGEWPDAPALGLGFTLRLIGNMARAANAKFAIESDGFILSLPRYLNIQDKTKQG
jgi:hypothetical protein